MSQPLPYGGFEWVEPKHYTKEPGIDHIYQVDLEYPPELHDLHNHYPCAAESIKVLDEMLSPYCKSIKKNTKLAVEMLTS